MILALGKGAGVAVSIFSATDLDTFYSCAPNRILKNDILCHMFLSRNFFLCKFMGIRRVKILYV